MKLNDFLSIVVWRTHKDKRNEYSADFPSNEPR
jgi:hypothetical protein